MTWSRSHDARLTIWATRWEIGGSGARGLVRRHHPFGKHELGRHAGTPCLLRESYSHWSLSVYFQGGKSYARPERRFPFYFPFKKRQVEMTTLASRVFVHAPGPERVGIFSRGEGRGFVNCEAMNADGIGIEAVHCECTVVNGSSQVRGAARARPLPQGFCGGPPLFSYFNEHLWQPAQRVVVAG